jgi:hypothetical protein
MPSRRAELTVVTMTLARGAAEEETLLSALTALSALDLPVIVADGGSSPAFVEALRMLPRFNVHQAGGGSGLVGQIRTALRQTPRDWPSRLLYTEPDKEFFFTEHLAEFLSVGLSMPSRNVVLAARSVRSFSTFPPTQQRTEGLFNSLCSRITDVSSDYCYGPFLMPSDLAGEIVGIDASVGWGWRPFLFARAFRLGLGIEPLTGDFDCPADQRDDGPEEQIHRVNQFKQNVNGLVLGLARSQPLMVHEA